MIRPSSRRGFTLTEILIATVIGAYLVSMAAVCVTLSSKTVRASETLSIKAMAVNGLTNYVWSSPSGLTTRYFNQWYPRNARNAIAAFGSTRNEARVRSGSYNIASWRYASALVACPTFAGSWQPDTTTSTTFTSTGPMSLYDGQYVVIHGIDPAAASGWTKRIIACQIGANQASEQQIQGLPARSTSAPNWRIGIGDQFFIPSPSWMLRQP